MPIRTLDPATSRTVIVTSSPRQILSPVLRVITSIDSFLLNGSGLRRASGPGCHRPRLVQLHLREEVMPNRVTASVVDDLAAETIRPVDDHRSSEIDREVLEIRARAHDAEDVGVFRSREPEQLGVLVAHPYLVVGEEEPRVGDGDGYLGMVSRVQPVERRALVLRDQRIPRSEEHTSELQ